MKAQEYVDKYMLNIKTDEECKIRVKEMFKAFIDEFDELETRRGVKTVPGLEGVVRELNDKWNSIATKTEKIYGQSIIKRNAIHNEFLSRIDPIKWPRK